MREGHATFRQAVVLASDTCPDDFDPIGTFYLLRDAS